MEPILDTIRSDKRDLLILKMMQMWEETGDDEVAEALQQLWRKIESVHGQ
jgi:hypothetical protein